MLTSVEIHKLLEMLAQEVVVAPTKGFPYTITQRRGGYSNDREVGMLQAKLSIMLEAQANVERRKAERG